MELCLPCFQAKYLRPTQVFATDIYTPELGLETTMAPTNIIADAHIKIRKSHWNWFGIWNYKVVKLERNDNTGEFLFMDCSGSGGTKCHIPMICSESGLTRDEIGFINNAILDGIEQQHRDNPTAISGTINDQSSCNGITKTYLGKWTENSNGEIVHDIYVFRTTP